MSNSNEDQNTNSKNTGKEESYNLLQTIIPNVANINPSQSFINPLQKKQNIHNITKKTTIPSDQSTSKNNSGNINIMQEMITKISDNDYNSIKELLNNSSTLTLQAKNKLLKLSFLKYNLANNRNQRKIINELINHGADANYKLEFVDANDKSKLNVPQLLSKSNIIINPLIYCCIKGDYELFELIKNKVNLSMVNDESNNSNNNTNNNNGNHSHNHNTSNSMNNNNKNYMFYFFENTSNIDNKYKILSDIFSIKNNNNNIKINLDEYDKQSGMTLLMLSVKKQYINFIKLFLENGADINKKNLKDGNTALHYSAMVKNKDIIEILLQDNNCNSLIKNNNNETIVDVASNNNCNTEIYTLFASKYGDQQKIFEEKKAQEDINSNTKENNNNNNYGNMNNSNINMYNGYKGNNNNNNSNSNTNEVEINGGGYDEGLDIIKQNQVNVEDLSSYLEIPFQFVNHLNYINYFESNNINNNNGQSNNNNFGFVGRQNDGNTSNNNNNNNGNIRNYLRFKNTPVLNINLKTEEDEELLILDNLKNENDKYDKEFAEIENRLEQVYNEQNRLLIELSKVNNEIKTINNEIDSYSKKIKENENKNSNDIKNINLQKIAENASLDILYSQENFINLQKCHDILLKDEEYLNKKFSDETFDDNQIKANLVKDIIDFQLYNKAQTKKNLKYASEIRSSLQLLLESYGFEYNVYIFGSYATYLCLPWSDLDLILISKNQNMKNINSVTKLQEIANYLNDINWVDNPTLVTDYYAFPFVTFSTDEQHGFMKVNLTIQDKKNKGYNCVKLTQEFLNTYKNLEPLTLIVKQLLKCSNTLFSLSNYNNPSDTLNSYSIILMIVYFLQIQLMGRTIEMINNRDYLGELFINFLMYYANFESKEKSYIFVRTGLKDSIENDDYLHLNSFGSKLIIIDPLDHKNNVSLKTTEFRNIQFILRLIYYSSRVKCDCSCHYLKCYNCKDEDKKNNKDGGDRKYVELGTEHCILKKIFKTAYRINSNLLKEFN